MADTNCDTCEAIAAGKLDSVSESDFRRRALAVLCDIVTAAGGGGAGALSDNVPDYGELVGTALDDTYKKVYDNVGPLDIVNAKIRNRTNLPILVSLDGINMYDALAPGDSLNIDFAANGLKQLESIYAQYDGDAVADAVLIAAETESVTASILSPA